MKDWIFLLCAIVFETLGTSMLKASDGFTRPLPTIITVIGYLLSFFFLGYALRSIPVGIAYGIWGAVGIVLIALVGMLAFNQKPDMPAIIGLSLIIAGVVIINIFSKMQVH